MWDVVVGRPVIPALTKFHVDALFAEDPTVLTLIFERPRLRPFEVVEIIEHAACLRMHSIQNNVNVGWAVSLWPISIA